MTITPVSRARPATDGHRSGGPRTHQPACAATLTSLHAGRADGSYDRRLAALLRPHLLILDDFGLKPLRAPAPEDLYEIIAGRYERGSIIITSNRAFPEWPDLFGEPLLASAALDRLGHDAHQIVLTGESYRTRATRRRTADKRQPGDASRAAG